MKSGQGNMAAPAKRIDGIDFWRGFALLTIFMDHVPENVFQHVKQQNFGFSDAAELFVFLSGVSLWPRVRQGCRRWPRARKPFGQPNRPPSPATDHIVPLPSGIRSLRSGPQ